MGGVIYFDLHDICHAHAQYHTIIVCKNTNKKDLI